MSLTEFSVPLLPKPQSIREFIKIKRGELQPSRTFVIPAPETPATETPAMSPVGKRRKRPKNVA